MRETLQREIDAVPEKLFSEYLRGGAVGDAGIREYPAIARLDATLALVIELAKAGRHLAAAGTWRGHDD